MKKITTIILSTACAFAVGSAFADLTIVNKSASDSTMLIKGMCTAENLILKAQRKNITKSGQTNSYNDTLVAMACGGESGTCKADLYAADNCDNSNDMIGTGELNLDTKTVKIDSLVSGHDVQASGSTITINK